MPAYVAVNWKVRYMQFKSKIARSRKEQTPAKFNIQLAQVTKGRQGITTVNQTDRVGKSLWSDL